MAKQAKKQPKKPEQLAVSKKILQTVVVATLLAFLGWLLLANPILNQLDKQRFLEAEKFIQELYETEIRPIAEPSSAESDNSCRYTSTKLGTGTLFCETKLKIVFNEASAEDAKDILVAVENNIIDNVSTDFVRENYVSGLVENKHNLSCISNAQYVSEVGPIKKTEVIISCSAEARAEHFQLES